MKNIFSFLRPRLFVLLLIIAVLAADAAIAGSDFITKSGLFYLNDFEVAQRDHPEEVWDKVVFGTSELISAYREDIGAAGYVNLGMDYGTMGDLWTLIDGGYINIGSELVLAVGWGPFYKDQDTNPTYIWHRQWYEPYVYFERDRFGPLIKSVYEHYLDGEKLIEYTYENQTKIFYYGCMTDEEQLARMDRLNEGYFCYGMEEYEEYLGLLDDVFNWGEANGVRVRVAWLPENPDYPLPEINTRVKEACMDICAGYGVEFHDMTDLLTPDCFYDTGHLNFENGAVQFTEVFDKWLLS